MAVDADGKSTLTELEEVKNDIDVLNQRVQVLRTLVASTMEQMSDLMDMMARALPPRASSRSFSKNTFPTES